MLHNFYALRRAHDASKLFMSHHFKHACYISSIDNTICDCYYYNFTTIKPLYHYYRRRA